MKLLAIDTATERCSVAVRCDGTTIGRSVITPRGHAELLLPMIEEVMTTARVRLADLDGLAFGRGPGAFTGVRIAAGVIQGLSLGSTLPVVGISNLAAVAQQVVTVTDRVLVCMDARMNEVYWGIFHADAGGYARSLGDERVSSPADVHVADTAVTVGAGTGFAAYPQLRRRFPTLRIDDTLLPSANEIALLGEAALLAGEGRASAEALPVYLRDQVASVKAV